MPYYTFRFHNSGVGYDFCDLTLDEQEPEVRICASQSSKRKTDAGCVSQATKRLKTTIVATIGNGLVVKKSNIAHPDAGNGLFADRDFRKNELVTFYDGRQMDASESKQLADKSYLRTLHSQHSAIDGLRDASSAQGRGGGSFANDGRNEFNANVKFVSKDDSLTAVRTIYLQALRPIPKGEEIFVSYGKGYWNNRL
jgi:hypothetical protein